MRSATSTTDTDNLEQTKQNTNFRRNICFVYKLTHTRTHTQKTDPPPPQQREENTSFFLFELQEEKKRR